MTVIEVCQWIDDSGNCRQPTIFGKSYCENHQTRSYITLPANMADYLIEQELASKIKRPLKGSRST